MKKENQFDVLVVGTGPGGMTAAKAAAENPDSKILMVDSGTKASHRRCPTLFKQTECKGCGGMCQIIEGVGGACSSVSCGMISEFPAGTGQLEHWSLENLLQLERNIIGWIENVNGGPLSGVDPNVDPRILESALHRGIELKTYRSSEVEGAKFEALMNALFADIIASGNVEARFRSRVVDIREVGGKFCAITQGGEAIEADRVIFATGRAGNSQSTRIVNKIGATVAGASGYLGVRFETVAHDQLIQLRNQVLDPKFVRNLTRMFCFCPQGKVVGMNVPNEMASMLSNGTINHTDSLEGCVWPNSPWGNFSVQTKVKFNSLEDWRSWELETTKRHLDASGGQMIGQSYTSLLEGSQPTGDTSVGGSSIPGRWRVGNIDHLVESPNRVDVVREAVKFIHDFHEIIGGDLLQQNQPAHVFAPEIHVWPRFTLSPDMQTTVPGLYVVGDMSGVARGILQAMNMGRVAGLSASGVDVRTMMGALA